MDETRRRLRGHVFTPPKAILAGSRGIIAFDPGQIRITGHHHADEWCAQREPEMTDRKAG